MKDKAYQRQQFNLKYCKSCNYVWEKGYCRGNRAHTIYKYKEMPSYGLERQTCLKCKGNNNANVKTNASNIRLETKHC